MQRTDIFKYFSFGYNYFILHWKSEGRQIHGDDSLESSLDEFFDYLTELELRVTDQAAFSLHDIRERIKALPADATVDKVLSKEISDAFQRLDATLDSELQLRSAFVVTPKRFDLNYLLDRPTQLLDESTREFLPLICRFDFGSACRCIAFGLPTAAAFHSMRCIEGLLRHYYCSLVKRDRIDPLLWGPMLEHLRKRRNSPPKPLLDHLDNIRANFRNPTQHPDARYVMDEAQDLLSLTIDALNRMARDFNTRKKTTQATG